MSQFVYIDESGDLGRGVGSSPVIIVASLVVSDDRKLAKVIKKVWRAKPRFHYLNELHAHAVDQTTRFKVLHNIAKLDCEISFHIIDKDSDIDLHQAYYRAIASVAGEYKDAKLIVVDKRDTKKKRLAIIRQLGLEADFTNIEFAMSHDSPGLQAVDFVAWAIYAQKVRGDENMIKVVEDKIR